MALPVSDNVGATREQVFVIGDSIGVQLLPHLSALASRDGILLKGAPVGGWRVQTWVGNAKGIEIVNGALDWPTTTFVVVLGTNDALLGQSPNLKPLVDRLRTRKAQVIWVVPGKLPAAGASAVSDSIRQQCEVMGIASVDSRLVSAPMLSDKIHFAPAGAKQFASWLWPRIKPELLLADEVAPTWLRVVGFVAGAVTFFVAGRWVVDRLTGEPRK